MPVTPAAPSPARVRRGLLALAAATAAGVAPYAYSQPAPLPPPASPAAPNLVIVFMDDGGYGDLASYGHPTIRTPRLDQMAREGTRFTQFYAASPACTASRYSLLTGRLPIRSGFRWVLGPDSERALHPREVTLAEALREQGYATACFGKWHLAHPGQPESMPLGQGFDTYYGLPYSNDMEPPRFPDLPLVEGNEVIELNPDQSLLTKEYTQRAIDFMRAHQEQRFFLYLAHAMPHVPLYPGEAFEGQSPRGTYGDVMEEIDWSTGQILDELRDLGLAEETLVIFTSDNGPWIIKALEGGSAGLLRDGKGSTWEGGMRVPMIAWWPGVVPADEVNRHVATTMDLFVTAINLAGGNVPDDRVIDGQDVTNLLLGHEPQAQHDPFFYYGYEQQLYAVRKGPWKLHIQTYSQTGEDYFDGKTPLLFHLEHDPSETQDVAADHPEVVAELSTLIEDHQASLASSPSFWEEEESQSDAAAMAEVLAAP